jgi:hypothetical protein
MSLKRLDLRNGGSALVDPEQVISLTDVDSPPSATRLFLLGGAQLVVEGRMEDVLVKLGRVKKKQEPKAMVQKKEGDMKSKE